MAGPEGGQNGFNNRDQGSSFIPVSYTHLVYLYIDMAMKQIAQAMGKDADDR